MSPTVSIITAMHNAAATVERTMRSLREQSEHYWECLIVNDASTDGSDDLARALAATDTRFRVLEQAHSGPGAARNRGLDAAAGEFIAFLDADDWLEPHALHTLLHAAGRTGASCGRCRMCGPTGNPIRWPEPAALPPDIGLPDLLAGEGFAIHSQLIRRDLIGSARFRTGLPCFEDSDFFLRLARQGIRWATDPHLVCWYRLRPRQRGTPEFAGRFGAVRSVLESHADARLDLNRVLAARAFNYATLMLLQDSTPRKDLAASVLASLPSHHRFSPDAAARAAHGYLPLSEETGLDAWHDNIDRYGGTLRSWWDRCAAEGWLEPHAAEHIIPSLARLIANDLDIPSMLVETLSPDRPVILLGLGANGIRLAHALAHRHIAFSVRDDAISAPDLEARIPGIRARLIPASIPFDPHAQHVMTLLDDAAFLSHLPRGLAVSRWSRCVADLSHRLAARLAGTILPAAA